MTRVLDLAARREAKPADPHDGAAVTPEDRGPAAQRLHRIVVVGGGAAGLELATGLGDASVAVPARKLLWWTVPERTCGSRFCMRSLRGASIPASTR